MNPGAESFVAKRLASLASAVIRHPRWFVYPQILLFFLSVLYTITFLEFDTSRNNLVGPDKKYHQNFLEFRKEFPAQDDLVVVVESEDQEKNRQFVERLGARLEAETNLFIGVFYKGDLTMLGHKALLFVPEADLVELQKALNDYRPFIEQFTRTTNLVSFFDLVNTQFRTARNNNDAENESLVSALPALERIVNQATMALRRPGLPPAPGVTALFDGGEAQRQEYITFNNGEIYLVTARPPLPQPLAATDAKPSFWERVWRMIRHGEKPKEVDLSNDALKRMRQLIQQTKLEVPGVNVGLTGEPVLEQDEMVQSQKDSSLASIVSLVLCGLIFVYGYQETGRPLKATVCLIIGIAYTMAYATATVGHLNILTITFVPMLIGLAIDFGVHLVTRYEEELRHGLSMEDALVKAMVFTGQGIFTGAFTTAGAFFAMSLTDFKGIQEMGIICGGGLLISLIPMMTLLPVWLMHGRQNAMDHERGEKLNTRARIERLWLRRPLFVVVLTSLFCLLALTQFPKVKFDYNLLNMQSAGLPAVVFERKLISATNETPRSVLFAAVVADSLDEAVALKQTLIKLDSVSGVDSVADYLQADQTKKLKLIHEIKREVSSLQFPPVDPNSVAIPALSLSLYSLNGYLGAALEQVQDEALSRQLASLQEAIQRLRKEMFRKANAAAKLGAFQRALFGDIQETFATLQQQDDREPLRIEDLPEALRTRFIGETGKYLLQVYPKEGMDLWQRADQEKFIFDLRRTLDPGQKNDPIITGTPIQLYEYTSLLKNSYVEAAGYALAAIAVLVFIHFRSLTSVVLSLLPVLVGSVWLGGLMGLFNIPLNPANIMTLPLVIGIGVTNGIHILNRFAEERQPSILAKSTGKAVLVSGLTTIAGFGSLILAKHQGIQSLGYVMATGVATCMIAGLTFLPALLNLLLQREEKKNRPSIDNARSTLGREEPR